MAEKDTELTQLWEEAVKEYLTKSKREQIMQKWKTPIDTQADLDKLIEQHESDFSQFRRSRGKFWGVLMDTMRQLQTLGNVARAGLGLTPFAPASVILEAGLFLIGSGEAVTDTYDALEILFRRIRDITDRLDEYLTGSMDRKLRKVVIKLLGSLLDVFCEAEAAIRRGRGKEMMRRVVGKENKIQSALDRLDEWVRTEIALIAAKTYATTRSIDEKAEVERQQGLLRRALCADAAGDNEAFDKNIQSSRLPRSGDWMLEEPLYEQWYRTEFAVLWILGKPGTGKTYLASRILSHIRQHSGLASYFYIREGMNTQHTPEVILKAITYQATRLYDLYREQAIAACKDGNSLLSPESIWETLFVKPFSNDESKPLYIVIDGVDEATSEDQELLVKLAKGLSNLRSTGRKFPAIQLLLLGRPELEYNVSNVWRGEKRRPKIIHINPSLSKVDVEKFIKKGVTEGIPLLQKMLPGPSKRLKRDIIKTLCDSSDGMFMLAKLMLAEVKDMNKPELIREALAKPPQGLDGMFKRVITRLTVMGGFDKKDLNEMIMWVACAKRDLLLGELDLVLKLRDLRQSGIVELEDELKTRFGSFFSVMSTETDTDNQDDEGSVAASDTTDQSASSVSGESAEPEDEMDSDLDDWNINDNAGDREDEDDDENVPHRFFVVTVKFGHASIGQHFRSAPFHKGIGMDLNLAQTHVALTCLLFLTDNIPKRKQMPWREPSLLQYSADHFLDHLVEVNFEELRSLHPDKFKRLADEVLALFGDRSALGRWFHAVSDEYKFMCQLFSWNTCSRLWECIPIPASGVDETNTLNFHWLSVDKTSLEILLEPFAQYVAEAWLALHSCDPMRAVLFLQGYQSTRDTKPDKQWSLPPNRPFEHIAESISPKEIREMALLGGLEKNSAWHLALGSTFSRIKTRQHLLAAVEEFQHTARLSDDPEQKGDAHYKEADALFYLGKYEDTIAVASKALDTLPAYSLRIPLLALIQVANLRLGNQEAALMASLKAWEIAPHDPRAAFTMIVTAHRTGQYSETVRIIRSLLRDETPENGARFLGKIIMLRLSRGYIAKYMLIACAKTGQLDLARDAFTAFKSQATNSGHPERMAAADAALAQMYFGFYRDEQEAIVLWENIVKEYSDTASAFYASFALAPLYFTRAMDSDPVEALTWVSKMEQLVELLEPMVSTPDMFPTRNEASALLGRWYAEQGRTDLARAKILPMVKRSIRDLTDRDDSNDYDAYCSLARALLCFGDRTNAAISWAFTKPLQKSKELQEYEASLDNSGSTKTEASKTEQNAETNEPFLLRGVCDGGCNRRKVFFKSVLTCEICVNIIFCDECHQKLIDGNTTFKICNPGHPMLEVYPPRGLVTKEAGGYMVRISDEEVVRADEWLSKISREWLGA